jgi:hypothetical protein
MRATDVIDQEPKAPTNRLSAARVARTEIALARVEDLALRFAAHLTDIPTVQGSIDKAMRELNGILMDIRVSKVTRGQPDVGAQAHMLTMAACAIIEALAAAIPADEVKS